ELDDLGAPAIVQNCYSLLERDDEPELIPFCRAHGIPYQAFSPLGGGWLTGKYREGEAPPPGSRMTQRPEPYRAYERPEVYATIDALRSESEERGMSMAALALSWALETADSVVTGPRRPEHLAPIRELLSVTV